MPKKLSRSVINQTALGNDNIQVIGSNNVITRITNFFAGDTEQRALRNRHVMLELVKNTWIKGVLEKSLYNEVLLELGMEERPGAVDHPWDMQVQMPDRPSRTIPSGTSIMQVFDEMNGAMLILGEPGSGKTTILLELARDCINRALQDDNQPIPVLLNLSSWNSYQPIDEWLVKDLNAKYSVSQEVAVNWVINHDLGLLLDGLDEVEFENREMCVRAINHFRKKYGLTVPIVVCSRKNEYEALQVKLNLSGALLLQPLTPEQIDEYFSQAGTELIEVRQTLQNDEMLQELVKQPLMLSILTLAYQEKLNDTFASENLYSIEVRRNQLLDTYIHQMFKRIGRTKGEIYNPEQTKQSLAWLAQRMVEHNAVTCSLEDIRPEWVDKEKRITYRLIAGMISALVLGLIGGLLLGILFGLVVGLIGGVVGWFAENEMDTIVLTWDWGEGRKWLGYGLGVWLFCGLICGLLGGLSVGLKGLVLGLSFGLTFVLQGGSVSKPLREITYPGQRISLSVRNNLFIILSTALMFGLIFGVMGGLSNGVMGALLGVLIGGLVGGVYGVLLGGINLVKVVRYYILRIIIAYNNLLPWRLIPFLNSCVDRIFLRRVGGGYIFVHRLLMEHFAAMYPASKK